MDPNNKDYSILGSVLGSPSLGKLPYGSHIAWDLLKNDIGDTVKQVHMPT